MIRTQQNAPAIKRRRMDFLCTLLLTAALFIAAPIKSQAGAPDLATLLSTAHDPKQHDSAALIRKLLPFLSEIKREPPELQFSFFANLAYAYSDTDDLDNADRYHALADQLAPTSVKTTPAYAYHLIGWAVNHYEMQKFDASEQLLKRLYDLTSTTGDDLMRLGTLNLDLLFAVAADNWPKAQALSEKALALAFDEDTRFNSEHQRRDHQALTLQRTARLYREFQPAKAIELYEAALRLEETIDSPGGEEASLHYLAILHLDNGNYSKSRQYINALMKFARHHERPLGFLSAYTTSSRLNLTLGDLQAAEHDILRAEVHLTGNRLPSLRQRFMLQKAALLIQQKQAGKAIALLHNEQALFAEANHIKHKLQYYELITSAYAASGKVEQAYEMQQKVLKLSQRWQHNQQLFNQAR